MTMAEVVDSPPPSGLVFLERNALIMAASPLRKPSDRGAGARHICSSQRYGLLPRNLIFVEVTHRKTPYIHDSR